MGQSEKMEQEDNRPKWLLELENRKRKPRLAHEVGAGAPCMTCSTACPGLDLHFWRKICKNCKCSRDDHDVPNDEFPQFNLLFGPSGNPNKKMIVLKVNKKKTEDEATFEWAPPNTTKELAADYMKALPEDKLPIKGSSGAALRKQQLQRQLPLHDIDHKVCDELSESERKQFEAYLENLKKYVGQGKVMKIMGARPFDRSLMTPANATDMNRFSPKHKQNQLEMIHSLNLRTPSSFVPKSFPSTPFNSEISNIPKNHNPDLPILDKTPSAIVRMEKVRSPYLENSRNDNSPQGRYHCVLENIRKNGPVTSSVPVGGTRNPPLNFATMSKINNPSHDAISSVNESIDDRSSSSSVHDVFQHKNVPTGRQMSSNSSVPSDTSRVFENREVQPDTQHFSNPSNPPGIQGLFQNQKVPSGTHIFSQNTENLLDNAGNQNVASGTFEKQSGAQNMFNDSTVPSDGQKSFENSAGQSDAQNNFSKNPTIHSGTQRSFRNSSIPPVTQNSLNNPSVHAGTQYSLANENIQSGVQNSSTNPMVNSGTQCSFENQNVPSGTQNSVFAFAASNMMGNDAGTSTHSDQVEKVGHGGNEDDRKLKYATQNNYQDTAPSSAIKNSKLTAPTSCLDDVKSWAKNDDANDEDAVRNFYESLLPPSSINSADIIGSTLDEKGLSFIREKLSSKYSAKDESLNHQSLPMRSHDLTQKKNGVKSKRIDQFRRQGAFDGENDVNEVTNNNSSCKENDELKMENPIDSLLAKNHSRNVGEKILHNDPMNYHENGASNDNIPKMKNNFGNEPGGQIMRGICDNYLGKNDPQNGRNFDGDNPEDFANNSMKSCHDLENNGKSLRAEMSTYGPGNTNIIRSESLNNPVFPEHARFSSGIVQNPVSIDHLRGDVEELSLTKKSKTHDCHQCHESIRAGDVVVTAEKANDAYWHPGCFICSVCNELLADLVYFYYKGKLYCGRDLPTLLEIPRCFACDELIFVREYTVAEGHNYHVKHFCCWDCDVPLAGSQYISENDRPLCLPCYQKTYAKTCCTCKGIIEADQQGVGVKNLNFHANDRCFCCAMCKKSLLNGKMAIKEDRPFCSKECITKFLNSTAN